jgi:muramoyltetrapeptide carboxypeptidase
LSLFIRLRYWGGRDLAIVFGGRGHFMAKRIGICAPCAPLFRVDADAVTALAAAEFPTLELVFHPQCFEVTGHFAGSDAVRADAFVDMANDDSLDALWCARGGYGSGRIIGAALPRLTDAARRKTYMGYSDFGFILGSLYRAGFLHLAHGSMVADIKREGGDAAVRRSLAWLAGADLASLAPEIDADTPTVAFNLTILSMIIGTDMLPDLRGHILCVEEVCEYDYATDRVLSHVGAALKNAGLAGLRLGEVTDVPANDRPFGETPEDMARRVCAANGIPYLGRASIGHTPRNHVVPFGLASRWRAP